MNDKYYYGIAIVVAIVVISIACFAFFAHSPIETSMEITSSNSLFVGDEFSVKLTADGEPLANQTITVTLTDGNGNSYIQNVTTNGDGVAKFVVDNTTTPGNCTIKCVYSGNGDYRGSEISSVLEVSKREEVQETQTTSSAKTYDDWQKDYETGEYDDDGNPIYRSVSSTSGGQSEPGIYETYWSASGPISTNRIG